MNLSPEKKIAGVLVPLFALRREDDLGIGDLAALRQFVDWAAEIGFRIVQLLPINETGGDNSPYNAISSRALEPTTIELAPGSPNDLTQADFDAVTANVDLHRLRHGAVKYPRVKKLKRALLEKAFARFQGDESKQDRFRDFRKVESEWLDDYTLFRALMDENDGSEKWDEWKPEQRSIDGAREWLRGLPQDRQNELENRRNFYAYVQWIAH